MPSAVHAIILNGDKPIKCHVGKKVEKAKQEIEKSKLPYTIKEIPKDKCPFCTPKTGKTEIEKAEELTAAIEKTDYRPGRCECGGTSFKLSYRNHIMTRECRGCGIIINLETMKKWEE